MSTDQNEAAFPFTALNITRPGLTKRELFAAMAMQGLIAANLNEHISVDASYAVRAADALIAALNVEREP